jgi:hypothetical protein
VVKVVCFEGLDVSCESNSTTKLYHEVFSNQIGLTDVPLEFDMISRSISINALRLFLFIGIQFEKIR